VSDSKRNREHLGLLAEVSEIVALLGTEPDLDRFLERLVGMVAHHLYAEVCSVYLLDDATHELVLKATVGLNPSAVGKIRLKVGEGLVGLALKELRPVCETQASRNPDYKHFPDSGEDAFESFLAVPILRGIERVGVVVVQRRESHRFSDTEVMTVRALTAQLATAVETVRAQLHLSETRAFPSVRGKAQQSFFVKGTGASDGCALGPAAVFAGEGVTALLQRVLEAPSAEGSQAELEAAIEAVVEELESLRPEVGAILPEVASLIFDAHLMMLRDLSFSGEMFEQIAAGNSPAQAVARTALDYVALFEASSQGYLREKARDVEDIALRLLRVLGVAEKSLPGQWEGHVLIAHELLPSDVIRVATERVVGIVLVGGGATSHVSILVRSLNIPMVIVEASEIPPLLDGAQVLIDADAGSVIVNPGATILSQYAERRRARDVAEGSRGQVAERTFTKCGMRVALLANINLLSELDLAVELKAEGVGLYRTEFPFMVRQSLPTEAEQEAVYRVLFEKMPDREVTIRTIDVGGDKMLSYFDNAGEANPALGLRSIRFANRYSDLFDQQLRAILRAAPPDTMLRVMFPMIDSIDELQAARERLARCRKTVEAERGTACCPTRVGMMVELPSVVELIDEFCEQAEFLSLGTNDFVQYMLAVDRTNERVAAYYRPHHPAVLRALKRIVAAAVRHGVPLSVCGEMAHDPRYIRFLIGIGVRRFSLAPHYLPEVQQAIGKLTVSDAESHAKDLLAECTIRGVEALL
jgi:phosphotransferase system, enzyme I, PtsP